MATTKHITIHRGATFGQSLKVASTDGKTYRGKLVDRFWCPIADLTCTVDDGTTVTISLTATQTADLQLPANMACDERAAILGHWDLEEVNGSTVARTHEGRVTISREATR